MPFPVETNQQESSNQKQQFTCRYSPSRRPLGDQIVAIASATIVLELTPTSAAGELLAESSDDTLLLAS
ncbi:hypothetical protein [Mesorhizobium argentiipisi]|uniref:Uncharacterized protein n=1 Tax=Mesorhizobium argentiipisi TaxID=3015175 RepID=A0ABU8KL40_9HYPH